MSSHLAPWALTTLWAVLAMLTGCADDIAITDGGADASVDGGPDTSTTAPIPVTPPDIPWLPDGVPPIMLAPCPDGWREVGGGDVTECDPYPEGGAESCEDGEAHFPGEPGCRPVGEACPPGDYATSLPSSGTVVYVNASAAAGGDGTLAAPFSTLGEVPWRSLGSSTTVALGKGAYPGRLPLGAGVSVVGACARDTVVRGIPSSEISVVMVTAAGAPARVQNLTLRGGPLFGVVALSGSRVELRGVLIDGVRGAGVLVDGAGTEVSLVDVVVRDTDASASVSAGAGIGIQLQGAVRLDASRLVVAGNRFIGLSAIDGATATLADTVIRDTRPHAADRLGGNGVAVASGSRVDATRVLFSRNRTAAVLIFEPGSLATLTDVVVRDTDTRAQDGLLGSGVEVSHGGELTATRLLVAQNHDLGVFVHQAESRVALTDVVIRDTQPRAGDMSTGRGLALQFGARCEATRIMISNNMDVGAFVASPGTSLTLTDALIQHTASSAETGKLGIGAWAQIGGAVVASRVLLVDNGTVGLGATDEDSRLELSDVVIRDTRAQPTDLRWGRGIQAQQGARVDGARLLVERSLEVGVVAHHDATVVISDTTIRGVAAADCASSSCPGSPFGYGVAAYSATLSLTRFHLADAVLCGLMVAPEARGAVGGSLDLEEGIVSGSEIGACVQVDGYDFGRLTNDVVFRDNGRSLDSTGLPVPDLVDLAVR